MSSKNLKHYEKCVIFLMAIAQTRIYLAQFLLNLTIYYRQNLYILPWKLRGYMQKNMRTTKGKTTNYEDI